jgi:hypothetical protein
MNANYIAILNEIIPKDDCPLRMDISASDSGDLGELFDKAFGLDSGQIDKTNLKPKSSFAAKFDVEFNNAIMGIVTEIENNLYLKDNPYLNELFQKAMNTRNMTFARVGSIDHWPLSFNQHRMEHRYEEDKNIRDINRRAGVADETKIDGQQHQFVCDFPKIDRPENFIAGPFNPKKPKHCKYPVKWFQKPEQWTKATNYPGTMTQEVHKNRAGPTLSFAEIHDYDSLIKDNMPDAQKLKLSESKKHYQKLNQSWSTPYISQTFIDDLNKKKNTKVPHFLASVIQEIDLPVEQP